MQANGKFCSAHFRGKKAQEKEMKTAVIDVGGGMRGIYAAGVLDTCLENGINFDLGIGVSAGSANIASFLARQRGRNFVFYTNYALRKEYMGIFNFFFKRNYVNLDYAYGTLSNSDGEFPIDYPAMKSNHMDFLVVATNALTGEAKYFGKEDISQDNYDTLKASSTLPLVNQPYIIGGVPYFDGALSDPVPVKKAFEEGCERVVLLLTKPRDFRRVSLSDIKIAERIAKKYPAAAEGLKLRAERYNSSLELAEKYEKEGRLIIVAPDDTCGVDTLTRDKENLVRLYDKGLADGRSIVSFMSEK